MRKVVSYRIPNAMMVAGIVGFLWCVPLLHGRPDLTLSAHDFERLVQTTVLFLASACLIFVRRTQLQLFLGQSWALPVQCVFFALVASSVYLSAHPAIALREIVLFWGLLQLSRLMAGCLVLESVFTTVLRILSAAALFYGVVVMLLLGVTLASGSLYDPWDLLIGFDNPRFLNHAQTVALPLVAIVSVEKSSVVWRRVAFSALIFSGMLLFLTYGRATLLGLFVGSLAVIGLFGRRSFSYLSRAFVPTLLGAAIAWVIYVQFVRPAGYEIPTGELTKIHLRDYLALQGIKLWLGSPWFGVGPMHFAHWYNGEAAHPHNFYVQVLCEYGAPAALMVLVAIATWIKRAFQTLLRAPGVHLNTAIGLSVAIVAVVVDSGLSGNFVMPVSQVWIALLVALVAAFHDRLIQNQSERISQIEGTTARRVGHFVATVLLGWLMFSSFQEAQGTTRIILPTSGAVNAPPELKHMVNPRYWTVGWF
jgi:O-Antigen ligase